MSKAVKGKLGFWAVVAIGVGGMVGGGIFAVLGLAVQLAHGGTPEAFALAGVVALLTTYSYAKLSVAYPSRGGTVTFLDRAFGAGMLTGSLNVLLWLSYVVMLSLYAFAFGSYGSTFLPAAWQCDWQTCTYQSQRDFDCRTESAQRRGNRQSGKLDSGIENSDSAIFCRRRVCRYPCLPCCDRLMVPFSAVGRRGNDYLSCIRRFRINRQHRT